MTSHKNNTSQTLTPPDAEDILTQFRLPIVRFCGAVVLPLLHVVKVLRRVSWEVEGIENIEEVDSPFLFAANHQSHIDTHVILDVIPQSIRKRTAAAAAFDHFADHEGNSQRKRIIHFLVTSIWNAFPIERIQSPLRSIRTMQTLLDQGWSILIYPEGTRSRNGDIASFKAGLGVIAKQSRRPVIPVCVEGGGDILPESTYIPKKGSMKVSFGKPLSFHSDDTAQSFMLRVEQAVREMESR